MFMAVEVQGEASRRAGTEQDLLAKGTKSLEANGFATWRSLLGTLRLKCCWTSLGQNSRRETHAYV